MVVTMVVTMESIIRNKTMTLVDLHSHILPGVDDGSPDIEHSLALAQAAVDDGITHMLLTPHHMDGKYVNHKEDVIKKTNKFQQALTENKIPLKVFPGQEVHINDRLLEAIDNDDILFADENNRYLMLELPHTHVPEYFMKNIFPELRNRGIIPIIVHPERNQEIQRTPDLLYEMVNKGCLTQLTASSYLNVFGKEITEFTQKIIDADLGFTFSSDAHNLKGRKTRMTKAYEKLYKVSEKKANQYWENGKMILNGEDVTLQQIKPIKTKFSFFDFLRKSK